MSSWPSQSREYFLCCGCCFCTVWGEYWLFLPVEENPCFFWHLVYFFFGLMEDTREQTITKRLDVWAWSCSTWLAIIGPIALLFWQIGVYLSTYLAAEESAWKSRDFLPAAGGPCRTLCWGRSCSRQSWSRWQLQYGSHHTGRPTALSTLLRTLKHKQRYWNSGLKWKKTIWLSRRKPKCLCMCFQDMHSLVSSSWGP